MYNIFKIFLIAGTFLFFGFSSVQAAQNNIFAQQSNAFTEANKNNFSSGFGDGSSGGGVVSGAGAPSSGVVSGAGSSGGGNQLVDAQIQNPIVYDNFYDFVAAIIDTAVKILMPFVVLMFVFAGFLFVKAQGNETELTAAKKTLGYSIVGAFILLGAWSFAQIIGTTITAITPPTN